ncbi:hypothetical protein BpHYR1_048009 [Brachionus plicatilis]|uniref:Uncharacterized protein n=1 Tax=Brachionus plicatilis TaxID=10195 RepID=A0A3M7TA00_BRAPC|nr:hypothetical protein BpHYR1_048009 [Brachionus plicatilis]
MLSIWRPRNLQNSSFTRNSGSRTGHSVKRTCGSASGLAGNNGKSLAIRFPGKRVAIFFYFQRIDRNLLFSNSEKFQIIQTLDLISVLDGTSIKTTRAGTLLCSATHSHTPNNYCLVIYTSSARVACYQVVFAWRKINQLNTGVTKTLEFIEFFASPKSNTALMKSA